MVNLLAIAEAAAKNLPVTSLPNCTFLKGNLTAQHTLPVRPVMAPVCLSRQPENQGEGFVGRSQCRTTVRYLTDGNCVYEQENGELMSMQCPFDLAQYSHADPALLWVCGHTGWHQRSGDWKGSCYPAHVVPQHDMYEALTHDDDYKDPNLIPVLTPNAPFPRPTPSPNHLRRKRDLGDIDKSLTDLLRLMTRLRKLTGSLLMELKFII